jgi:hypothetical protein
VVPQRSFQRSVPTHPLWRSPLAGPIDLAHFLSLGDRVEYFTNGVLKEHVVRVWGSRRREWNARVIDGSNEVDGRVSEDEVLFCELIPSSLASDELQDSEWDMHGGAESISGFVHIDDRKSYARFGDEEGRELLVIERDFGGVHPEELEICEAFRLWHNLRLDVQDDGTHSYLRYDASGESHEVVRISPAQDAVDIDRAALFHFLVARRMHLALYFDSNRSSGVPWKETFPNDRRWEREFPDQQAVMEWFSLPSEEIGGSMPYRSFSSLTGKRLIAGKGDISSPTEDPEEGDYDRFIVGVDHDGPRQVSCDPKPLARNYLTPVFFRKDVLSRYLARPSLYEVGDSFVKCASLWRLTVDNHHDGHVIAWLGDLGRDLPRRERQYWRGFNILPTGRLSVAFERRQIFGEFAETDRPEFLFKRAYDRVNERWGAAIGWPLFLPPRAEDSHLMRGLHVPISDEQREFDEQVLALAKLLVDFLNEAKLGQQLTGLRPSAKGIDKLEGYLMARGRPVEGGVDFLRRLQGLRSSACAHRKGKEYQKALGGLCIAGPSPIERVRVAPGWCPRLCGGDRGIPGLRGLGCHGLTMGGASSRVKDPPRTQPKFGRWPPLAFRPRLSPHSNRCREGGSNPQRPFGRADFKSAAFTISPSRLLRWLGRGELT